MTEINPIDIAKHTDHTLLAVTATEEQIIKLCEEANSAEAASVCVSPCYVNVAKQYVKEGVKVCTVIGFPNGYNTTASKEQETLQALENGADEIDMVINVGALKSGNYSYVLGEVERIRDITQGKILKVIIECCLLTDEEKKVMCGIVSNSGADYIKTSTGFSKGGAVISDIILFKDNLNGQVKIKAAGGIRTIEDAKKFLLAGCDRIGSSAVIKEILA